MSIKIGGRAQVSSELTRESKGTYRWVVRHRSQRRTACAHPSSQSRSTRKSGSGKTRRVDVRRTGLCAGDTSRRPSRRMGRVSSPWAHLWAGWRTAYPTSSTGLDDQPLCDKEQPGFDFVGKQSGTSLPRPCRIVDWRRVARRNAAKGCPAKQKGKDEVNLTIDICRDLGEAPQWSPDNAELLAHSVIARGVFINT